MFKGKGERHEIVARVEAGFEAGLIGAGGSRAWIAKRPVLLPGILAATALLQIHNFAAVSPGCARPIFASIQQSRAMAPRISKLILGLKLSCNRHLG